MRVFRNWSLGVFCGACLVLAACSAKDDDEKPTDGNKAGGGEGGTGASDAGGGGDAGASAGNAGNDAGGAGASDAGSGGEGGEPSGEAGTPVSAGTAGTSGSGDSEDVECTPCTRGCAAGDPHMVTFDGTYYDFQAAGEFVLSTSETFEVQARLEATTLCNSAAIVKAIALDSSDTSINIYADADDFIRLGDGRSFPAGDIDLTLDDWSFEWRCDGLLATKDSGDAVFVSVLDGEWLNVEVRPADSSRDAGVSGLLGDADENAENDLALPDGSALDAPVAWSTLYGGYADAWRVSEEASLFAYGDDESAADYAGAGIPGVLALDRADPDELAAAEQVCENVEDLSLYDGCLVDVMCGGADASEAAKWFLNDLELETHLLVTPPNSITGFSRGSVSCADSGDASVTLTDTLELNRISTCIYARESQALYLSFDRVDEQGERIGSSYVAVEIRDFTGIGSYPTDASLMATSVSVVSDEGTCTAASGFEDNSCGAEPGLCTIDVLDTNLPDLVFGSGGRNDGMVRFRISCGSEFYRECGPQDELETSTFEHVSFGGDVINCDSGL